MTNIVKSFFIAAAVVGVLVGLGWSLAYQPKVAVAIIAIILFGWVWAIIYLALDL